MEMPYGGATMAYIMSTISAYFRTHHGNETHTYFGICFYFTYVQKQRSKKKYHGKHPLRAALDLMASNLMTPADSRAPNTTDSWQGLQPHQLRDEMEAPLLPSSMMCKLW